MDTFEYLVDIFYQKRWTNSQKFSKNVANIWTNLKIVLDKTTKIIGEFSRCLDKIFSSSSVQPNGASKKKVREERNEYVRLAVVVAAVAGLSALPEHSLTL